MGCDLVLNSLRGPWSGNNRMDEGRKQGLCRHNGVHISHFGANLDSRIFHGKTALRLLVKGGGILWVYLHGLMKR